MILRFNQWRERQNGRLIQNGGSASQVARIPASSSTERRRQACQNQPTKRGASTQALGMPHMLVSWITAHMQTALVLALSAFRKHG